MIGDHVPVKQLQYGFVNAPMHGFEEMLGAQPYLHILSDAVVDHQRAQQGGFRLDIARQAFFRRVLRGNPSYILVNVLSSAHCAKETRGPRWEERRGGKECVSTVRCRRTP